MQRNGLRFAVVVAIVLTAMAAGIGLGFALYYYLFKPIRAAAQQWITESISTIRFALD